VKLVLLIFGLGLGAVLLLQWRDWPPQVPVPPVAEGDADLAFQAAPEADTLELMPLPPREEYASVIERPLFLPDRRPPPDEPAMPTDDEPPEDLTELDGMDLSAVVITPSSVSAWVRAPQGRELVRLRLGDDFEGWTVTGIEPERLLLERQGEADELVLRDYQNAPALIPPTRVPQGRERQPTPGPTSAGKRQPEATPGAAPQDRRPGGANQPPVRTNASSPQRQRPVPR
jgi:hypothetical protein